MPDSLSQCLVALLPVLRRFALDLTNSSADADDLVQAACERALIRAGQWQPGSRLDSWLFCIMQNLWIDWRRSSERQGIHVDVSEVAESALAEDSLPALEARLDLARIGRALETMPANQRRVMMLACVRGLSHRECAQLLEVPVGTVMSRLARARETLFRTLDPI